MTHTLKTNPVSILLAFIVLSACTTYKWVAPPYTNVEKLASLKSGMSIEDVNKNLGIQPFNIYHIQEDGSAILTYNYRLKDRKAALPASAEDREDFTQGEAGQIAGEGYYQKEGFMAYALFTNGKLNSVITDEGLKSSEYIMMTNHNLKLLSHKDIRQLDLKKIGDVYLLNGKDTVQIFKMY